MLFTVDPSSAAPLFEQIASAVRIAVVQGSAQAGERLPAARDLASALGLNVHTVLHAYRVLRDEGLIELHRGRGATISPRAAQNYDKLRAALAVATAEANRLGLHPQSLARLLESAEDS